MGELQRLGSLGLVRLPADVFARLGGTQNPRAVTWECPTCGVITPTRYANGYLRATCACERARREAERREQQRQEDARASMELIRISCARCYTWLGEGLGRLSGKSFEGYEVDRFPAAYHALYAFAHAPEGKPRPNVLLFGSVGTGKTHLVAATLNVLRFRLVACRFMTGQGLFDAISEAMGRGASYQRLIDEASRIPVLAIDDIDKVHIPRSAELEKNFQTDTFFSILNKRYIRQLPTILTTNALDVTTYIGAPAFSRLKENGQLVEMVGPDYRDSLMRWE